MQWPRTSLRVTSGVGGETLTAFCDARVERGGGVDGRSILGSFGVNHQ